MAVLPVGIGSEVGAGGYQIERSLRFNSADSAYLNRTPASAGNRKTWTWSGWVKRSKLATSLRYLYRVDSTNTDRFEFDSSDRLFLQQNDTTVRVSTQVFRDVSAWYHIVLAVDTTQATANNRYKIYVNGSEITTWTTQVNNAQNTDGNINSTNAHKFFGDGSNGFDGYAAELHFIDGSALDPTSFGEFNTDTGVWQPIEYTGTYGTNGFYLDFADNSGTTSTTLGADSSGNGNNWTPNNFSVTAGAGNDSLVDSPTRFGTDTGAGGEVRGNYCTWNTVQNAGALSISNGNLDIASKAFWANAIGTLGATSGKWYFEATLGDRFGSYQVIGVLTSDIAQSATNSQPYNRANSIGWEQMATLYVETTTYSTTDYYDATVRTASVAFDLDNWKFHIRMDGGAWQNSGDPAAGTGGYDIPVGMRGKLFLPFAGPNNVSADPYIYANFGQRPFAYTAPSGFKALVTTNLPAPTIEDGGEYFDAVTYTGNGTDARVITTSLNEVGLAWVKIRSGADDHRLANIVTGGNRHLKSNNTDAESTGGTIIQAFSGSTFTVGTDAAVNGNGSTYVGWCWKANGAGVSNTAGTITSTVSANTDSGFSIVTYTGNGTDNATFGHGLGVKPAMVIIKSRSDGSQCWNVWHQSLASENYFLWLNTSNSVFTAYTSYQKSKTSSVVTLGTNVEVNASGGTYVAYCFAEVPGFSSMGSYVGNGSADGPFVYTGFRPAFLLIKRSSATENWGVWDSTRNPYNVSNRALLPSSNAVEQTDQLFDLLSNGFKARTTTNLTNISGQTYIYMAFAENPFAYSLAR